MGYSRHGGVWRHPRRMVLFLGDIIDRGPRIREACTWCGDMVEAGQALCIMGNHEYNALGWYTEAPANSERRHVRAHAAPRAPAAADPPPVRGTPGGLARFPRLVPAVAAVHRRWAFPPGARLLGWRAGSVSCASAHADGRIDRAFVSASAVPGSSPTGCSSACCAAPTCACRRA